ncbi:MAG: C39 family peptidase, partial [Eubacterium sp.]|nr:C39 family peptidase [Eubacterium sp.]
YYYFSRKGVLRKKNITVDGMKYLVNKKNGKIYGFVMKKKVTPICQQPELPSGCEIVAWTMMVRHAGIKMNKMKAVNLMPRASNPNLGFVGSPFSSHGYILVVYPGGLMSLTKKYLGTAVNMTGKSEEAIQKKLRKGHIVMAWVAGLDGFGSHTIALTGYDDKKIYYNDPWTGTARTMSWAAFRAMWAGNGRRALSY